MRSISPGKGLGLMEGKFSLTQFSPREQEVLTSVLPHYGQGHPMHSCSLSLEHVGLYPLLLHTPQIGSDTSGHSCLSTGVPVFPRHTSLQNILLAEEAGEEKEHVISQELKKMVRDKALMTVSRCLLLG